MVMSLVLFKPSARPVHPGAFVTPQITKGEACLFQNGGSLSLFIPKWFLIGFFISISVVGALLSIILYPLWFP